MKYGYDVHMATLGRVKYSTCLKFVLYIRYTHITHITQTLHLQTLNNTKQVKLLSILT